MKNIFVIIAICLFACGFSNCSRPSDVPPVAVTQECQEVTPELLSKRARHEKYLDSVANYMQYETEALKIYLLKETGTLYNLKVVETEFVNDYEIALVFVQVLDSNNNEKGGAYWIIANPEDDGRWATLEIYNKAAIVPNTEDTNGEEL